jgi:hypothetical protein
MTEIGALGPQQRKVLAYGPSMSGKTTFLGHIIKLHCGDTGEGAYICNFDTEYNLAPVARMGLTKVQYDQYTQQSYDTWLTKVVTFLDERRRPFSPKVFAIENGARAYDSVLYQICSSAGRAETPQIQDYRLAQDRMIARLLEVLKIPCLVYVSFHDQTEKDEASTGRILGKLLVTGRQLPDLIPPMFNTFLHFSPKAVQGGGAKPAFRIFTASDGIFGAGDKFDALPAVEEDFDDAARLLLGMPRKPKEKK